MKQIVTTGQGQRVDLLEVAGIDKLADVYRDGKAGAQQHRTTSLGDVLGQSQPRFEVVLVLLVRPVELGTPENVGLKHHDRRVFANQRLSDRGLAGSAGAAHDKEQSEAKGVCAGTFGETATDREMSRTLSTR